MLAAKLFLPLLLTFVGLMTFTPSQNRPTLWFYLLMLPFAAAAVWMAFNLGEIAYAPDGLLYRKWIKWRHVRSSDISNVVRVLPCFAALVLNERARVYFLPDPNAIRLLRALSLEHETARTRPDSRHSFDTSTPSVLHGAFMFAVGVVAGISIRTGGHGGKNTTSLGVSEARCLLMFVGISITYLIFRVIARKLKSQELYVSLALLGLGLTYLFNAAFYIF